MIFFNKRSIALCWWIVSLNSINRNISDPFHFDMDPVSWNNGSLKNDLFCFLCPLNKSLRFLKKKIYDILVTSVAFLSNLSIILADFLLPAPWNGSGWPKWNGSGSETLVLSFFLKLQVSSWIHQVEGILQKKLKGSCLVAVKAQFKP